MPQSESLDRLIGDRTAPAADSVIALLKVGANSVAPLAAGSLAHTQVSVATTSTGILAANVNRRYGLFVNDSDAVIYLRLGTGSAVLNQGIRLNANGGSYEMASAYGNLHTGEVQAIHGLTGTKVLLVTEGS